MNASFLIRKAFPAGSVRRVLGGVVGSAVRLAQMVCLLVVLLGLIPDATAQNRSETKQDGAAWSEVLHLLFEQEWEWRKESYGKSGSSLPDVSAKAHRASANRTREFLKSLSQIDRSGLSRTDQISAQLFERQLRERLADVEFGVYQIPVHTQGGFHRRLALIPHQRTLRTKSDVQKYMTLLRDIPRYVEQHTENMRLGLERGMTQPAVVIRSIKKDVRALVVDQPEASPFYAPFDSLPADLSNRQQRRFRKKGRAAVRGVTDAFRAFGVFLQAYENDTRTTIAATALPDGEAYYDHQIRRFTTVEVSADVLHRIGLREVGRIRAEMKAVMKTTGFTGSLQAFMDSLRTAPRFTPASADELLKEAAWIAKRMDGELPALFGRLPRQPYTIAPIPEVIAPTYAAGRYIPAPAGGTRPGTYWINTRSPQARRLYTLEALTLHEAVPGHHLQISLAREREDLPAHRRNGYLGAFTEGWALYAERLGLEAGFYADPYSNFGRLTYEMGRACRLVVDTGIHAKGWSRERAIQFMASNTALPDDEIVTEIDRYISWPGQALSYKVGELKIRALRQHAEEELGEAFDLRAFHDVVLGSGAVTLPILEETVLRWIDDTKAKAQ